MTDFYNGDLTEGERPVLSERANPWGGQATDDSGMFRITDPVTGASLFTSNMDPNVVGVNAAGATAAVGTDVLFGPPVNRFFASKLINGNFQQGPPRPNDPIAADNPLPGWRYVVSSGDAFILRWARVGNGNGQVTGEMRSGAAGDLTYLEQLAPAQPSTGPEWQYEVVPYINGTLNLIDGYCHVQFIDGTLANTGSAASSIGQTVVTHIYPGSTGQAPGDAERLRVRAGFQRSGSAAATDISSGAVLSEVAIRETTDVSRTWTPTLTAATPGDLNVAYTTRQGRYRTVGRQCIWSVVIVTSTWTHSTAAGGLLVSGLPFTALTYSSHRWLGTALVRYTKANFTQIVSTVDTGEAFIRFPTTGSGQAPTNLLVTDCPTGTQVTLYASGVYEF